MPSSYGLGRRQGKRSLRWLLPFLLAGISGLVSLGYATQRVAGLLDYQAWLGDPVWGRFYWPWSIVGWWENLNTLSEVLDPITNMAQALFVLPQLVFYGIWHLFLRQPKGEEDVHGTAGWATEEDIRNAGLLSGEGVYVGGWQQGRDLTYLRHNGPEHVLVFAPTRSGKGVGLVLPTLLSWPDSAFILDIKGENWALTSGWRKSQGHVVLRFDPTARHGAARFNPLAEIRLEGHSAIPDAQNVASMLVDPEGKGLKDYWNKAAFSFLSGAVLHCLILIRGEQDREATLNDLSVMLADPDKELNEVINEMLEVDHAEVLGRIFPAGEEDEGAWNKVHEFIGSAAREMKNKAPNEFSGVASTAVANLALYRDPVVAWNTSACDFRITDLMNHDAPVSLYLVIRPSDIDRLRPLIRLMANLIFRRLTESMEFENGRAKAGYNHRLLLMMDEFTSLGRLEIFERSLAFMAGYGLKAYLIVQDLSQLRGAYTREESIMSNCHIRVAYAPNKMETAEELSKMSGKTTVVHKKTSVSGNRSGRLNRANVSFTEVARPLLTPDECMRLPGPRKNARGDIVSSGDMLIFPAGFRPVYGRQILYFLDREFARRARMDAPPVSDSLAPDPGSMPEEESYDAFLSE